MAKFLNNVMGLARPADLLDAGQIVSRPNDPLEGLFDDIQTDNLVAEWYTVANQYQISQMAEFHAFDTISQKIEHAPIDEHNIEKGLIKAKRNTSELLRQLIHRGIRDEEQLYRLVMEGDVSEVADAVVTRAKVARAELMATGQVTIKENGMDLTVSYGVPAANLAHTIDVGKGATTDVLTQIQDIVDAAADEGTELTGMVCSRTFLGQLRKNSGIQKAINGTAAEGVLVRNSALEALLADEFGISQIIVDDLQYSEKWNIDATTGRPVPVKHRYFPKAKVSFFGSVNGMRLGAGLWGAPPEVEIANFAQVGQSDVSPYVYITQWAEKDPSVIWTKASALYMPLLFSPESLHVATVTETPGA